MDDRLDRIEPGLLKAADGLGLTGKLDSLERKLDILDRKVDRLAVLTADMSTEIQKLAEGVRRFDQNVDRRFQDLNAELEKDRAMFMAAIRNHEVRISALEAKETSGESG